MTPYEVPIFTPFLLNISESVSVCELDVEDDVVGEDCSKEELDASGAQIGSAFWFLVGQGFIGLGSVGYWTLGLTYMDDGLPSKHSSSVYVASLFMLVSISPIVAFALSGFALSLHTNFYKIDVDELGYDDKDPRWIGAWWLGYIIYGFIMGLLCIPYFFFPKDWPQRNVEIDDVKGKKLKDDIHDITNEDEDDQPSAAFLIKSNVPDSGSTCSGLVKGYFSVVRRLTTNMTYMAVIISSVSDSIMFAGFFSFLGRYLQTQYDVTPSMTSIILGCITSPPGFFGNMIGGLLIKRLKLSLKGNAGIILIVGSFTLFAFGMLFVVSCDTVPIAGLNTPYPDGTDTIGSGVPLASCMRDCSCPVGVYTPVCGSDGVTYVTPCHAGCTAEITNENNGQKSYSNCPCIESDMASTTSSYNASTAVFGKCPSDCDAKKYGFVFLLALIFLMYSFLNVPGFLLFMRSVENKDKAVAIAFSSLLQRVLAYIPAPIAFGAAIQTTCMLFQESCGITGNCLVYDNYRLSRVLIGLVFAFKCMALIMYAICFLTIQRNKSGEYQALQLCRGEEQEDVVSIQAALDLLENDTPYYPYETRV